jgi:hypothetical protein
MGILLISLTVFLTLFVLGVLWLDGASIEKKLNATTPTQYPPKISLPSTAKSMASIEQAITSEIISRRVENLEAGLSTFSTQIEAAVQVITDDEDKLKAAEEEVVRLREEVRSLTHRLEYVEEKLGV